MSPQASESRRWLNQSTYSRVAISTCSTVRHGPPGLMSSVLNSPITVSARALVCPEGSIVYCKQDGRDDEYPVTCFTFLGFDFRRAPVRRRDGVLMCGFVPLVGRSARKSMSRVIRQWRLGRRTDLGFRGLAAIVNPVVSGWINYYGRFYKSELVHFLEQRINPFLVKWMVRKYKRLRRAKRRARRKLAEVASAFPALFAHWRHGARPTGSTVGAV